MIKKYDLKKEVIRLNGICKDLDEENTKLLKSNMALHKEVGKYALLIQRLKKDYPEIEFKLV